MAMLLHRWRHTVTAACCSLAGRGYIQLTVRRIWHVKYNDPVHASAPV